MSTAVTRFWTWITLLLSAAILLLALSGLAENARRDARERRYLSLAVAAAAEFDVPMAMVLSVMRAESDFDAEAVSRVGAVGLMQLMPETYRYITEERLKEHLPPEHINDPKTNLRYGAYYLSYLFEQFGDWRTVLAAYNAGEGCVREWLAADGMQRIPFPETDRYVDVTLSYYEEYRNKYKELAK